MTVFRLRSRNDSLDEWAKLIAKVLIQPQRSSETKRTTPQKPLILNYWCLLSGACEVELRCKNLSTERVAMKDTDWIINTKTTVVRAAERSVSVAESFRSSGRTIKTGTSELVSFYYPSSRTPAETKYSDEDDYINEITHGTDIRPSNRPSEINPSDPTYVDHNLFYII